MDRRFRLCRAFAGTALISALAWMSAPGLPPGLTGVARADTVSDESAFVNDINAARISRGVGTLVVDPRLTALARWWAAHMAAAGGISHNPALAQMGPPGWTILGENVGMGPSEPALDAAFTASPHHYENMVDPRFSAIGVGEVVSNGTLFVAEEYMAVGTPPTQGVASVQSLVADPAGTGYWLTGTDGTVSARNAPYFGSASGFPLHSPIISMAPTASGNGYWLAGSDGGIFSFGDAMFYGSTGALHLNAPIVGMAPTPSGHGYWLVATDGGIFAFGDAGFYGSTGALHLNAPIVGMAPSPSGHGYWLVASDGGIFAFGDAGFRGSTGSMHLNARIVGMAPTRSGRGYWLVASDGGIFTFGDAAFYGSAGAEHLAHPISGMTATPAGAGYWLVETGGAVHAFGDATS